MLMCAIFEKSDFNENSVVCCVRMEGKSEFFQCREVIFAIHTVKTLLQWRRFERCKSHMRSLMTKVWSHFSANICRATQRAITIQKTIQTRLQFHFEKKCWLRNCNFFFRCPWTCVTKLILISLCCTAIVIATNARRDAFEFAMRYAYQWRKKRNGKLSNLESMTNLCKFKFISTAQKNNE